MSTTSIKSVPTLNGMFSVPKINHRRDFLRENKLNLRELQRITTKNKSQQALNQKQPLRQQPLQQYGIRRSVSQQRALTPHQPQPPVRSNSQQRNSDVHKQNHSVCSHNGGRNVVSGKESTTSLGSKAESCDKEIQTEDIYDEEFLYEALKKCSSSDFRCHNSNNEFHSNGEQVKKCQDGLNVPMRCNNFEGFNGEEHHHHQQQDHQLQAQCDQYHHHSPINNDNEPYINSARVATARSQTGSQINGHRHHHDTAGEEEDDDINLGNLEIDNHNNNHCAHQQQPLSGGSRHTICSQRSKRSQEDLPAKKNSSGSLHKSNSRDDVRLPRYLEREKREKKEERMRAMMRDPNCPIGHVALTDDERLNSLATTEKKIKLLIDELNHMPMTMETLRIRTRKAEIEKELAVLEADIRVFSKHKVYVKE